MKVDIEKLRKKRKWTGRELGLALMANTLNDIKFHNQEHTPLFSQEEFAKMEKTIKTDEDEQVYSVYRSLYSSILDAYNTGLSLYQQFYNGYSNLTNTIDELKKTESIRERLSQFPILLTKKQYDAIQSKVMKTYKVTLDSNKMNALVLEMATQELQEQANNEELFFNGIAIIETENKEHLDKNGYYQFHDPLQDVISITSLARNTKAIERIRLWKYNLIYNAMAYFYAYNAMLRILEKVYDIENLASIASLDTFVLENEVKKLNMSLISLHDTMVCGTDAIKEKKRKDLHAVFNALDIESLKPREEDLEKVRQTVEKLEFTTPAAANLKYLDDFLSFLSRELV